MVDFNEEQNNIETRSSVHVGYFNIINMCNFNLLDIVIRHTQKGYDSTTFTAPEVRPLSSPIDVPKYFEYATGFGTPYDYWYIEFSTPFGRFATKNNFYCSLTSSDNGNVVIVILPSMDARIEFSSSSSCVVSIKRKE